MYDITQQALPDGSEVDFEMMLMSTCTCSGSVDLQGDGIKKALLNHDLRILAFAEYDRQKVRVGFCSTDTTT